MPSAINTNLNSLAAQRQLGLNASSLGAAMQRLSSGLRINGAKDDAAGLAISERMTTQIRGVDQAARNTNDGISMAQTADAALGSISNNLQRIRELAVQAANSTNSASDRAALQSEVAQLIAENDRVASQTEFNGTKLLDGTFAGQSFQVGANRQQTIAFNNVGSMTSSALGKYNGVLPYNHSVTLGSASPLVVTLVGPGTTYNLGTVATDAQAIADTINRSGIGGLSATIDNGSDPAAVQTSVGAVSGSATYTLNGVAIQLSYVAGAPAQNRANAIAAINAQSTLTGVYAYDKNGSGVALNQLDGRNFYTSYSAGTATGSVGSDFGLTNLTNWAAKVLIGYQADPGLAVTSVQVSGAGVTIVEPVEELGTLLRKIDVLSVASAKQAIGAADTALATVNAARANFGALQNRLASAQDNLRSSSENMTAARGRIQDADFAQETATLSRTQILQQASTAMVAQANQTPQTVLALLK